MRKTYTRRAFAGMMVVSAASLGMALSGCSPAARSAVIAEQSKAVETADLVVIGSGGAGLAGAAKAAQGGASVIVLEAEKVTGGTTAVCGGHYKFMDDDFMALLPERTKESDANLQQFLDLKAEDVADFAPALEKLQKDIKDYLKSDAKQEFDSLEMWLVMHYYYTTYERVDPVGKVVAPKYDLIYPAYANSGAIKDWLAQGGFEYEAFGTNEGDDGGPFSVNPIGPMDHGGASYIAILQKYAEDAGAKIITRAKATTLIEQDGRIVGVQTEDGRTFMANHGVLLASGGIAANGERVAREDVRWKPDVSGLGSCEPANNDGTALAAAEAVGAATANLGYNQYQTFPLHGAASIPSVIPMCMMASVIAVNRDGVRYHDDSQRFGSQNSDVSLEQPGTEFYMIGDAKGIEMMGEMRQRFEASGDLKIADTIEEVAEASGLPAKKVAETVEKWNSYVDAGSDPDFGRDMEQAMKLDTAPFTIMAMKEYVQHTMGGVCIDPTGHVVDGQGNPIEGLYAAGEAVGNLDGASRRHGDNFAQLLYYGSLCGETIAAEAAQAQA